MPKVKESARTESPGLHAAFVSFYSILLPRSTDLIFQAVIAVFVGIAVFYILFLDDPTNVTVSCPLENSYPPPVPKILTLKVKSTVTSLKKLVPEAEGGKVGRGKVILED